MDYFANEQMVIRLVLNKYTNIFVISDDRKSLHPFNRKTSEFHIQSKMLTVVSPRLCLEQPWFKSIMVISCKRTALEERLTTFTGCTQGQECS